MVGSQESVVFWHHGRTNEARPVGAGWGLGSWSKKSMRLWLSATSGRSSKRSGDRARLVITADHGYAACGEFHDLAGDQATYMKGVFKSGRSATATGQTPPGCASTWPDSVHGPHPLSMSASRK